MPRYACVPLLLASASEALAQSSPTAVPQGAPAEPNPDVDSSASGASLEAADLEELSLEELLDMKVVTASGTAEKRELASATVRVITRLEIERRGYQSIAEVLASVPGLYVVSDYVTPSLSVRGVSGGLRSGTRIVRVMIDGVQVNFRPDLTAFLGPEYIPLEAVERVEVALGPLSAMYGANAFLATVNIITSAPQPGVSGEVRVRAGQRAAATSGNASGSLSLSNGKTSLTAAFVLDRDDRSGLSLERTFPSQLTPASALSEESEEDLARGRGGYARLSTESEQLGALTIAAGLQELDSMGEFQVNSLLTHANRLVLRNYWSRATWVAPCESVCASVSGGWSQGSSASQTDLRLTDSDAFSFTPNYDYGALSGEAKVTWAPSEALELTLGADGERDRERILYYTQTARRDVADIQAGDRVDVGIAPEDPRQVTLSNIGAYVQARGVPLALLPDLRLTGNLRIDSVSQGDVEFPLQVSWRTSATYQATSSFTARVVTGHAFQTPSAVLTFARPGFGTVGNIVGNETIGSLDRLDPQTVTSVEVGATLRLAEPLVLEGSAYYQQLHTPIEFVRLGANFRAQNADDARENAGLEATLGYTEGGLRAYVSGSVQRTLEDGDLAGEPPASFPNVYGLFGLNLALPEYYLNTNAELRWVGERGASQANTLANSDFYTLPAYGTVDLTLSSLGLSFAGERQTRFKLGVRNLLDARYSEPGYGGYDIPNLGRRLFVEAQLQL